MGWLSLFLSNQTDGIFRAHGDAGTASGTLVFGNLRDGDMSKPGWKSDGHWLAGVAAGLAMDIGFGKAVILHLGTPGECLTGQVKHRFRAGPGAFPTQCAAFAGKADLRKTAITTKQHLFRAGLNAAIATGALVSDGLACPGRSPLRRNRSAAAQKKPAGLVHSHVRPYPPGGPGGPMNTWDIQTRKP
ncbi:hypothetical protein MAALD49_11120 [Marinobacter shengliensis]|nr:hypothetical protein MAALD49_11120 [Marinobacter shengliensis]